MTEKKDPFPEIIRDFIEASADPVNRRIFASISEMVDSGKESTIHSISKDVGMERVELEQKIKKLELKGIVQNYLHSDESGKIHCTYDMNPWSKDIYVYLISEVTERRMERAIPFDLITSKCRTCTRTRQYCHEHGEEFPDCERKET